MAKKQQPQAGPRVPAPSRASQTDPNLRTKAPVAPLPQDPGSEDNTRPIIKQELAISQESAIASRFELLQYNPDELFTKKGVKTLEKMATTDDVIAMGLASLKMMALSSGYTIEAASEDPADQAIADEVACNFENMVGSLREKLFSVMGALDLGVSFHEKIWDFWPQSHPEYAGHVRLVTLKSKKPQWFNPSVDDFNNITGFVMISPPAYGRKLPARKFLVYSGQKRYENVWGTARTRALYDWWYLKGLAKASLAVLLKKYGKETPIGYVPPTMGAADKQSFMTALLNLATTAAMTVPEGTRIEYAKFDPTSIKSCLEVIEKADQSMTKVLMGQVSSSGTSSGQVTKSGLAQGAGEGKGAQGDTLSMYLSYICADISENPFAELIKEIVDFNYNGVTKYPKFVFSPSSEEDQSGMVSIWIAACAASQGGTPEGPPRPDGRPGKPAVPGVPLVTHTEADEAHIRQVLGFPSVTGDKESLRPSKSKAKPVFKPLLPIEVIPAKLPMAGYRPPTPSAPGMPANFGGQGSGNWGHDGRPGEVGGSGGGGGSDSITHKNPGNKEALYRSFEKSGSRSVHLESDEIIAYHGTSMDSAKMISEQGIKFNPEFEKDNINPAEGVSLAPSAQIAGDQYDNGAMLKVKVKKSDVIVNYIGDDEEAGVAEYTTKKGKSVSPENIISVLNTKTGKETFLAGTQGTDFGERPAVARKLSSYEEHVDFAESWRILDTDGEDLIATKAAEVLRASVDKLKGAIKRALGDSAAIRKMTMPGSSELAKVFQEGLTRVAKAAMSQAASEMRKKGKVPAETARLAEIHNLEGMVPKEVLAHLNDRAFTMAADVSQEVLKKVKQTMYSGLRRGDAYSDMVYKIEEAIAPYIDLTQAGGDLAEHRLMNVVRTNVATAYNDARLSIFEDPELNGFTLAYQFSAILDGDTTDWCRHMDGRIFKVSNPLWADWTPPTYYQCRSVLVPITKVDGWDGVESEEPTEYPPEGFN